MYNVQRLEFTAGFDNAVVIADDVSFNGGKMIYSFEFFN